MVDEKEKQSLDLGEMSKQVAGKQKRLRGLDINIRGKKADIANYSDVAFAEMPSLFIEDDGRRSPFLRVVTEKGSYRIKLEKI